MHDEYRDKDEKFIEREGRLLFLCFLKPIINGKGFYYVESETRMDNRMDIVVTYGTEQHIIALKIWHGESYENEAFNLSAAVCTPTISVSVRIIANSSPPYLAITSADLNASTAASEITTNTLSPAGCP